MVKYPITCVKSCNGSGKSFVDAGILLWFASLHANSKSVVAAPTTAQLAGVLWSELTAAMVSAEQHGRPLGGKLRGLTLEFGENWRVEGFGQGSVESKSGRHAKDLFALIDEASGVHPSVHEAIDSLNPSKRLYTGNPIRPEGKFYELCQNSKDNPNINVISISAFDCPHIHLERSPWGAADKAFLDNARYEYGEDSLWWTVHVLGQFPDELQQALLPIAWLNAASEVQLDRSIDHGPRRCAVDVAKGNDGDESCIVIRDDDGILDSAASSRWNLERLARETVQRCRVHRVEPSRLVWDATGVGTDFGNRLAAEGFIGCRDYMGSRDGGEKFANLRSACGWLLRRRLDPNRSKRVDYAGAYQTQRPFHLPKHLLAQYRRELQECRYALDSAGRIQLETKEEFQKRIKRSPNFLDALAMTYAFPYT